MQMLYLRQTKNELTGEHSAIMLRALSKTSKVNDTWLESFVQDTQRRFISLLGGPFRDIEIRLAISTLEQMAESSAKSGVAKIKAGELDYMLTSHDLKRLELYGRNLCDHHLITDLLPISSRLYFSNRFGNDFKLSSVQSAILCGIGLQNRDVDSLTKELGLPSNQLLAMFNKAIRKISIALNNIVEEKEKEALLSGEKRKKAQEAVEGMRDVASATLEEDEAAAARDAMESLGNGSTQQLPEKITKDRSLMHFAVKGSDDQWAKALEGKDMSASGTIQIKSVREKRKQVDEEDFQKAADNDKTTKKHKPNKNKKKKGRKSL